MTHSYSLWRSGEGLNPPSGTSIHHVLLWVHQVLWLDEEHVSADVSSTVAGSQAETLPQQSTPHPSFATEVTTRKDPLWWNPDPGSPVGSGSAVHLHLHEAFTQSDLQ